MNPVVLPDGELTRKFLLEHHCIAVRNNQENAMVRTAIDLWKIEKPGMVLVRGLMSLKEQPSGTKYAIWWVADEAYSD
jgi:hypothetical protein